MQTSVRVKAQAFRELLSPLVSFHQVISSIRSTGAFIDPFADSQAMPVYSSTSKDGVYMPVYVSRNLSLRFCSHNLFRPAHSEPSFLDQQDDGPPYGHVIMALPAPQDVMASG
jgi:hypothetical protein